MLRNISVQSQFIILLICLLRNTIIETLRRDLCSKWSPGILIFPLVTGNFLFEVVFKFKCIRYIPICVYQAYSEFVKLIYRFINFNKITSTKLTCHFLFLLCWTYKYKHFFFFSKCCSTMKSATRTLLILLKLIKRYANFTDTHSLPQNYKGRNYKSKVHHLSMLII